MLRLIGPALIFSGAAIGTSHLVQSTRAGAVYGMALVVVIILACLLKYPAFRFGVDYGHARKQSLMVGYRELGPFAPILFALVALSIMPIIHAALAAATAGIVIAVFGLELSVAITGTLLLGGVAIILMIGAYDWLEKINKVMLMFLIVSTLLTAAMVVPRVDWSTLGNLSWAIDPKAFLFVIALAGFMPNPLDVSLTQSMWTAESERGLSKEGNATLPEAQRAFLTGYTLTALLAICFCIMGAGVMHSAGVAPESSAPAFATQVIELYRSALGDSAAILASIAALSVMFTTLLAALDIGGRNIATTWQETIGRSGEVAFLRTYRVAIPLLVVAAGLVLFQFTQSFTAMLDLATTAAFVGAPIIATLNHLVVTGPTMPKDSQPSRFIRRLNLSGIVIMSCLAVTYLLL